MDIYKLLLKEVWEILKKLEFQKDNYSFWIKRNNNWGALTFQKSRASIAPRFTMEIVISSTFIRQFMTDYDETYPKDGGFHYSERLGFLLSYKKDHWWDIDNSLDFDEIKSIINEVARPHLEMHVSDTNLKEIWLKKINPCITEFERLAYLTILLSKERDALFDETVRQLIQYSRGKACERTARIYLHKLGVSER